MTQSSAKPGQNYPAIKPSCCKTLWEIMEGNGEVRKCEQCGALAFSLSIAKDVDQLARYLLERPSLRSGRETILRRFDGLLSIGRRHCSIFPKWGFLAYGILVFPLTIFLIDRLVLNAHNLYTMLLGMFYCAIPTILVGTFFSFLDTTRKMRTKRLQFLVIPGFVVPLLCAIAGCVTAAQVYGWDRLPYMLRLLN